MLAEQIRHVARECAEESIRRHRESPGSHELAERPGPAEWEALRELLGVSGEPARGTAQHDRFLMAEEIFVETFAKAIRSARKPRAPR